MGAKLTAIAALGALALAPAASANDPQVSVSASLSPATDQAPPSARRPSPAPRRRPSQSARAGAAQAGRAVSGLYLGGSSGRFVQLFSLRLNARGTRATQRATLVVRCNGDPSIRSVLDNLTLAQIPVSDGRADGSGSIDEQIPASVPAVGGLAREGLVTYRIRVGSGGRAAGVLRSRFRLTDPSTGSTRARCDTGRVRWSARIVARDAGRGDPAPAPGSGYFGATAQKLPFVLDVLPGGVAVRPAGMAFRAGCPSLRGLPLDLASNRRMPISRVKRRGRRAGAAGGRFGSAGRFTRRYFSDLLGQVTETYRWRLRGRFGAEGAAGTWRVDGTVVRDADGARVGRCTTGRNRWRAVR